MLIDEIKKANLLAMKNHDQNARTAYSMVISNYQTLLSSGRQEPPTDADVVRIIQKFSKELDEEMKGYETLGRTESLEATKKQKEAIMAFLPKLLTEQEIKAIIDNLEDRSIPAVMKHFKANYEGKCDMGLVAKVAKN